MRLAVLTLAIATTAAADPLPGGATVTFDQLELQGHPASEADRYFNLAHCACSQAQPGFAESSFAYRLSLHGPPVHAPLEIWVGAGCDDPALRAAQCHPIASARIADLATLAGGGRVVVPVYDLMEPEPPPAGCDPRAIAATEWAAADGDGDGALDYFAAQPIATDAQAPPLPTDVTATVGNGAIELAWTPPADTSDIAAYQALCTTDLGAQATIATLAPRYTTARALCGAPLDVPLHATPIRIAGAAAGDAAPGVALAQELAELDPSLVCGEQTDPSASGMRLDHLQADRPAIVVLLAIDRAGNAAAAYFTQPIPTRRSDDFWRDLHERGGAADGGFCLIADTFGARHPVTEALRAFRDDTLAASAAGRALVRAYYIALAPLGRVVRGSSISRVISATLLAPLVALALAWHALTLPGLLVVMVFGCRMMRASRPRGRRRICSQLL